MNPKSSSGLNAALIKFTEGALIVGDASTPLADNSWFKIVALAGTSTLPIGKVSAIFKSPKSGSAITPAIGDNVYPLTLESQCKVTAELSTEKGVIDVSDDCGDGYISNITDGFSNISGSYSQFLKFDADSNFAMSAAQTDILSRFYDIVEDDGDGTYTVTEKSDDDVFLMIMLNRKAAIGDVINSIIVPIIVSSANTSLENKSGMNLDVSWTKAEGWAGLYKRTLNVAQDL